MIWDRPREIRGPFRTELPLVSLLPAADFLVLHGSKSFPPRLHSVYPFSHLGGMWARRAELVNGRPAYTFAYSWASSKTPKIMMDDGRATGIALWYSPLAARIGHAAGEGLSGWIIGASDRLGLGYTTAGPADFLINSSTLTQYLSLSSFAQSAAPGHLAARVGVRSAVVAGWS